MTCRGTSVTGGNLQHPPRGRGLHLFVDDLDERDHEGFDRVLKAKEPVRAHINGERSILLTAFITKRRGKHE